MNPIDFYGDISCEYLLKRHIFSSEKHVQDSKQKKGGSATNGSEKTAEGEEQQHQQQAGEQDKANLDMLS